MPVTEADYERLALQDPESHWEFICGRPRSKPAMTLEHNRAARVLGRQLEAQLDLNQYDVCRNDGRLRLPEGRYYVPDVFVLPRAYQRRLQERPSTFEVYDEPMPLVVEVWSPSTGDYDVEQKLRDYQQRGDAEIWRIHPYDKTLTAWRRRPDGSYEETTYRGGSVQPAAPPGVTIQLERLFE